MAGSLPPIPLPPPSLGAVPAVAELHDFRPDCPDCRYDLGASPDGRCPECGLHFTHAALKRHWIARKKARRSAWKQLGKIAGGIGAFVLSASMLADSAFGATMVVIAWTAIAAVWAWMNREMLMARSYYFLGFLAPLVLLMPQVAATTYGLHACAVLGAFSCIAGWLALRWSPLISGVLLLGLVVIPLAFFACVVFIASTLDLNDARYWSSFSQPTPTGWHALPALQSRRVAIGIACVAAAIVVVVSFSARRALVRLRARNLTPKAA